MLQKIDIDYKILHDKYVIENKGCLQISKELGLSNKCVRNNLKRNKIPLRPQMEDLTGKKFNMITVLSYLKDSKNTKKNKWICKCDCGKEIVLTGRAVQDGRKKDCGCRKLINVNFSGSKFGKLTAIKQKGINKHKKIMWECKCECGSIITADLHSLRRGQVSCGCTRTNQPSEGQKINRLTVMKRFDKDKHGNIRWLCECECGEKSIVSSSVLYNKKVDGCTQCAIKNRSGPKSSCFSGYQEITGTFWGNAKQSAKTRNLKFLITIEQVWELFLKQNKKCALSGLILSFNTKADSYIGTASLDRMDSSKDYTIDNVQWVHKDINIMKNNHSDKEFINYCKLVTNHNAL